MSHCCGKAQSRGLLDALVRIDLYQGSVCANCNRQVGHRLKSEIGPPQDRWTHLEMMRESAKNVCWQMLPSHVLTRGEVQLVRDHFCGSKDDL